MAGIGLALATAASAFFDFADSIALSTLLFGTTWAALLRWKRASRKGVRRAWFATAPLGALNAATIAVFIFTKDESPTLGRSLLAAGLGLVIGALYWIPAVLVTLLFFGLPIRWSHRLARRGIAGEVRGDRIVATAVMLVGFVAPLWYLQRSGDFTAARLLKSLKMSALEIAIGGGLSVLLGAVVALLATWQLVRQTRFLAKVERGDSPKFRIKDTEDRRVLVRVEEAADTAYRVSEIEVPLAELDEDGTVRRTLVGDR